VAQHGKEAYQKYPFLYITCNNPDANDEDNRPGSHVSSRTSTISEATISTGMYFNIFMKNCSVPFHRLCLCRCIKFCDM
jgi:hypothetical protein